MREISWCLSHKFWSQLRNKERFRLWMMWLTSLISKLWTLEKVDHTRRADIVHQACQCTLVFSQPTCTYRRERHTIGAHVELVRSTHFVMVSASGWSLDAVPWLSTWRSQVTSSCATARCQPMPHSAMEPINISGSGELRIIEDSFPSWVPVLSGSHSATGGWPSTNEDSVRYLEYC